MRIANLVIPEVLIGECFNVCFAHAITYTDLRRCAGFFCLNPDACCFSTVFSCTLQ